MTAYPERSKFFAHKFTRLLHKSCASQDIGRDAVLLLVFIVHTEDAARYSGPVKFWNSQLSETMGFRSPKQLNEARRKAVEAGWLVYCDRGNRVVGEYFVSVPERFAEVSDEPIFDQVDQSILSAGGTNSGTIDGMNVGTNSGTRNGIKAERIAVRERNELRNESGTNSGKPPIPVPATVPLPSPSPNSTHTLTREHRDEDWKHLSDAVQRAIRFWNRYWVEKHGCGHADSPTKIEAMLLKATSAGWSDEQIVESITTSVAWGAQTWRDPEADHDKATKARINGRPKPKYDPTEQCF